MTKSFEDYEPFDSKGRFNVATEDQIMTWPEEQIKLYDVLAEAHTRCTVVENELDATQQELKACVRERNELDFELATKFPKRTVTDLAKEVIASNARARLGR